MEKATRSKELHDLLLRSTYRPEAEIPQLNLILFGKATEKNVESSSHRSRCISQIEAGVMATARLREEALIGFLEEARETVGVGMLHAAVDVNGLLLNLSLTEETESDRYSCTGPYDLEGAHIGDGPASKHHLESTLEMR